MAPKHPLPKAPPGIAQRGGEEAALEQSSDRHSVLREDYLRELLRIVEMVEKAAKRPFGPSQGDGLVIQFANAVFAYCHTQFIKDVVSKLTLHDIAGPLAEVIANLEH